MPVQVSFKRSEKLSKISIGGFTKNTNHRRGGVWSNRSFHNKMLIINLKINLRNQIGKLAFFPPQRLIGNAPNISFPNFLWWLI